jgi:hypothetical protein
VRGVSRAPACAKVCEAAAAGWLGLLPLDTGCRAIELSQMQLSKPLNADVRC